MSSDSESSATHKSKKKKILLIATGVVLLLVIVYLIYWAVWSRFVEKTNDAYVNGNSIQITPNVGGLVTAIYADNTQLVEAGDILVQLDPHDFEVEMEKARADLADRVRRVEQMFIKVKELTSKQAVSLVDLFRANQDFDHREALVEDGSISREEFEHSQMTLFSAYGKFKEATEELEGAQALIENTTVRTHPEVEQAKAALKKAYLAMRRSTIRSPVRGIVTQRKAQVGQWVQPYDQVLWIVPLDQLWVDANLRETDLKHIRVGQPVKLVADMYQNSVKFQGSIVGLNPGTGSVFSILPPQNASGNWIKIVQRLAVKIRLEPEEIKKHPLLLGMSMTVRVDTHDRSGLLLPNTMSQEVIYKTDIYTDELQGADEMIETIIAENTYSRDSL